MSWTDKARDAAAKAALNEIKDETVIGLGSGNTLALIFKHLKEAISSGKLHVKAVPASSQSEMLCIENRIPITSLNECPQLDLVIDGADQVEPKHLKLIKGGGASLLREKILMKAAIRKVIIIDENKITNILNMPVPVEVLPFCYIYVMKQMVKIGAKPALRIGLKKNGPIVTDNGNYIIDADFGSFKKCEKIEAELKSLTGVIETGLFLGLADKAYVGMKLGGVKILSKN